MTSPNSKVVLCPSARADGEQSRVFGLIGGTVQKPEVIYLDESQPVTEEILSLSGNVDPTEIFRIADTCEEKGCKHFTGKNCNLAVRMVESLAIVSEFLPPCSIRRDCRWWQQEGKAACFRCPQVITDHHNPSALFVSIATPQ